MRKLFTVCIPSYNRSEVLAELLDSVLVQDFDDFDILICEDMSPERAVIRDIVTEYQKKTDKITYVENEKNLGYDANIRNLVDRATGHYCFFMGNDDLLCEGTLAKVGKAIREHDNVGVVLRTYASFNGTPDNIDQIFRYFDKDCFFSNGDKTINTFYRRSVVIPGMVINKDEAVKYATDKFDGVLLYQLYLVANVLVNLNGLYISDVMVLYRNGGIPYFGNSEAEKHFVPEERTPESSLHFMQGMFDIAKHVEDNRNIKIYKSIVKDIGNYSYPILSIQSKRSFMVFLKYGFAFAKMGVWKSVYFWIYFLSLLVLGEDIINSVIKFIKQRMGYTPALGKVYKGENF